ncbi:MAG: hypothetical protein ACTSQH_02040 [Candidatus Hodarchaeales archaeon]
MLLSHLKELPTKLPKELIDAATNKKIILNGGDFSLELKPSDCLFFEGLSYSTDYQKPVVLLLITPSVRFAYDPHKGQEISNTMKRYKISDRSNLSQEWKLMLQKDSHYLRKKGLENFAVVQNNCISKL